MKPANHTSVSMLDIQASETVSASRLSFTPLFSSVIRVQVGNRLNVSLFQIEHTQSRKHIPSLIQLFSINKMFSSDPVPPSNVQPDTLAGD